MAKFIVIPFADQGNKTTIPDTGTAGGVLSYQYGYTPPFSLKLGVDPSALPIGRNQFNQLMNDLSGAIRQYQTEGVPDWVSAADNDGTALAYDLYARVRHTPTGVGATAHIYENQVQGNTATPGADNTWFVVDSSASQVPTGTMLDYAGLTPPSGFLLCDGSVVSAVTYPALAAVCGTSFGAATLTTFTLPDLRRHVKMGAGGTATGAIGTAVGSNGGTELYQLVANDLPPHTHTVPGVGMQNTGTQLLGGAGWTQQVDVQTGNNVTTNQNVSLMQPTLVITPIIKT